MTLQITLGQTILDQFPVYADDGYTKVSGVTGFTISLWKDTAPSAIPVTITEIGSSGEYQASFTPDDEALWTCEILIPTNKQYWYGEYQVAKSEIEFTGSMAEDGTTARFTVWGEDKHGRAAFLTGMVAEIRNASGGLVTILGPGIGPSASGTFLFSCSAALLSYNTPYFLDLVASFGAITWNGNSGFVRID